MVSAFSGGYRASSQHFLQEISNYRKKSDVCPVELAFVKFGLDTMVYRLYSSNARGIRYAGFKGRMETFQ